MIINEQIRLRAYEENDAKQALKWYRDPEIQWLVNGKKEPYTLEKVKQMFLIQQAHGELFMIEMKKCGIWELIGDVALMDGFGDDLPIMIGERSCWGKGIGKIVLKQVIAYAKEKGRESLGVTIYPYNTRSINLFKSVGFRLVDNKYQLELNANDSEDGIDNS